MKAVVQTFDTYKVSKNFQESGFKPKQVEALLDAFVKSKEYDLSQLATKSQVDKVSNDIARLDDRITNLEERMNERFINLEERLNERFISQDEKFNARLKAETVTMIKWMVGTMLGSTGICITIVKLLG